MDKEKLELIDEQLENISGGEYIPEPQRELDKPFTTGKGLQAGITGSPFEKYFDPKDEKKDYEYRFYDGKVDPDFEPKFGK